MTYHLICKIIKKSVAKQKRFAILVTIKPRRTSKNDLPTLYKNLCCAYIVASLNTNFENKSKKVLNSKKRYAIIVDINKTTTPL